MQQNLNPTFSTSMKMKIPAQNSDFEDEREKGVKTVSYKFFLKS